jgi:hypothetical protein
MAERLRSRRVANTRENARDGIAARQSRLEIQAPMRAVSTESEAALADVIFLAKRKVANSGTPIL